MRVYCGFCEEPLTTGFDHQCEELAWYHDDMEYDRSNHTPFTYSPMTIDMARTWFDKHPEFSSDFNPYYTKTIGAYVTREDEDYWWREDYTHDGIPVADVEGASTNDYSREDEWDAIYANRDAYQRVEYFTYRDVEPKRCTHAARWWHYFTNTTTLNCGGYGGPYIPKGFYETETYRQRYNALNFEDRALGSLEFEELQAFATETLIDAQITENYQYRFFNIYPGRDGKLHIGLLTFATAPNGLPQVTCSQSGCYYRTHPHVMPAADPENPTRKEMEDFIIACIRHGNNHGPSWYVNRQDFSFIHAENCDTHHTTTTPCNANVTRLTYSTDTLDSTIDFLIRHRKFCRDTKCRCTLYYHTLNHYARTNNRKKVAA